MRKHVMMSAAAVIGLGCGGTGQDDYEWRQIPIDGSGLIWDLVVVEPNRPVVVTDAGLARYDGTVLQLIDPQPPCVLPNAACTLRVDPEGTIYVGTDRLPPGASAWESIAIPGVDTTDTPWPASDASVYVVGTPEGEAEDVARIYRLGPGETTWEALGPAGLAPVEFFADALGNMWFEQPGYMIEDTQAHWITTPHTLYRANSDGVEYIGFAPDDAASTDLQVASPDGTLYFGLPYDVYACGVVSRLEPNGQQGRISEGTCVDSEVVSCECEPGNGLIAQWEVDRGGVLWAHWRTGNFGGSAHILQVLRPGSSDWEPITAGPPSQDGALQAFRLDGDRIWAIANGQVFSVGDGGHTNWVFGGLWVRERKDAPSRSP